MSARLYIGPYLHILLALRMLLFLDTVHSPSPRFMVTAGMDATLRVWDVRTYQPLHSLYIRKPAADVSVSQRGLVATGHGKHCQVC